MAQFFSLDLTQSGWNTSSPPFTSIVAASGAAPSAASHSMAISPDGNELTVLVQLSGVYSYDVPLNTWQAMGTLLPQALNTSIYSKQISQPATDPSSGFIYWPSGSNNGTTMLVYNPTTKQATSLPMPASSVINGPVSGYAIQWSKYRNSMFIYGGNNMNLIGDDRPLNYTNPYMIEYKPSTDTWTRLVTKGPSPGGIMDHCMASAYGGEKMVVFGGKEILDPTKGAIYILDIPSLTWTQGPNVDPAQNRSAFACTAAGDNFVAWGGNGNGVSNILNTTIIYNLKDNVWTDTFTLPLAQTSKSKRGIVGGIVAAVLVLFISAGTIHYRCRGNKTLTSPDKHSIVDSEELLKSEERNPHSITLESLLAAEEPRRPEYVSPRLDDDQYYEQYNPALGNNPQFVPRFQYQGLPSSDPQLVIPRDPQFRIGEPQVDLSAQYRLPEGAGGLSAAIIIPQVNLSSQPQPQQLQQQKQQQHQQLQQSYERQQQAYWQELERLRIEYQRLEHARPAPVPVGLMAYATTHDEKTLYIQGGQGLETHNNNQFFALDLTQSSWNITHPPWKPLPVGVGNTTSSPSAYGLSMAISKDSTRLVELGGRSGTSLYDIGTGTWSFKALNVDKDSVFLGYNAATDPNSGLVYVPGASTNRTRMLIYDFATGNITDTGMPSAKVLKMPVSQYGWAWNGLRGSMMLLGGSNYDNFTTPYYNPDLIEFNVTTSEWNMLATKGQAPPPLMGHCFVSAQGGRKMVAYGGVLVDDSVQGDIYILDVPTLTWTKATQETSSIVRRQMACTVARNYFIVWGGQKSNRQYLGLAIFDLNSNEWVDRVQLDIQPNPDPIIPDNTTSEDSTRKRNIAIAAGVSALALGFIGAGCIWFCIRNRKQRWSRVQNVNINNKPKRASKGWGRCKPLAFSSTKPRDPHETQSLQHQLFERERKSQEKSISRTNSELSDKLQILPPAGTDGSGTIVVSLGNESVILSQEEWLRRQREEVDQERQALALIQIQQTEYMREMEALKTEAYTQQFCSKGGL
ncbi:Multiple epidermal growth factor-like domains protein 8 [Linnemannia zychae]|nr:Multiple epidermal growth factor-like domains protein 8 [Linnemannia zychae]